MAIRAVNLEVSAEARLARLTARCVASPRADARPVHGAATAPDARRRAKALVSSEERAAIVTNALDDAAVSRLTHALVRGDAAALATLYASRFDWMLMMLQRTTRRDESFALDCAQDAWLRVARTPVDCASATALDAWLRRVALSAALDRVRSDAARRVREMSTAGELRSSMKSRDALGSNDRSSRAEGELAETLASIELLDDALRTALDRIGDDDRGLLLMRFRAGMTLAQIGAACGLGSAAIDSRLRRLLATLRASINEQETVR